VAAERVRDQAERLALVVEREGQAREFAACFLRELGRRVELAAEYCSPYPV